MNVGRGKETDDVGHDLGRPAAVETAILPHNEAVLVTLAVGDQDVRQVLHDLPRAGCHLETRNEFKYLDDGPRVGAVGRAVTSDT